MAQTNILSSITRTGSYPLSTNLTAGSNCGTMSISLTGTWDRQMISELPTINFAIYLLDGTKLVSIDFDMNTFTTDNGGIDVTNPYTIPLYNLPESFSLSTTPIFDNYAIESHNAQIETGNVELFNTSDDGIVDTDIKDYSSELWTTPTATFNLTITFDDSNIVPGSGGGGGGGYVLPVATATTLGGIKVGTSLVVDSMGVAEISSNAGGDGISVAPQSDIPSELQVCDYIENGTSFDTGINGEMIVTIDASFTQTNTGQLLGFALAANQYFGLDSQNRITAEWTLDDYVEGADSSQRNMISCKFQNNERSLVSVEGIADTSLGYASALVSNYGSLPTLNMLSIGGYPTHMKLYGATIKSIDGLTIFRNYIPCYVKATPNSVGLYDKITKTFYPITGATKGPDAPIVGLPIKISVVPATSSSIGGVIVGNGLDVQPDGTVSVDVDSTPTQGSTKPVSSNGVYTALATKPNMNQIYGTGDEVLGDGSHEIPSGADINTYTEPGVYYSPSATVSASLYNTPYTDGPFKLVVQVVSETTGSTPSVIHIIYPILPSNVGDVGYGYFFTRSTILYGTWTNWYTISSKVDSAFDENSESPIQNAVLTQCFTPLTQDQYDALTDKNMPLYFIYDV